ncbi:hypothetical protein CL655_01660 [bacterium]|nr:hypothetical protein [bacterium]|tara:strand:+ start:1924 stop:2475 length:552 start_codon:yes stop_codon:yes gene_type:complete
MTDQTNNDGQKTVVAFVAGLLVGGLLVWIFSDTPAEAPTVTETVTEEVSDETSVTTTDDSTATEVSESTSTNEVVAELPVGEGSANVSNPVAGSVVTLEGATFPTDEGWVAVRTYTNGELGWVLGASRYSREQGLVPETIELLSPTVAGRDYAIVFYSEDGNRVFNLGGDVQLDTDITPFTAQ